MIVAIDVNPTAAVDDLLGGAADAAGKAALDAVVNFVFGLIADAVSSITTAIVAAMNATTSVDFDGGFFPALTPIRRTVLGMSTALILALFFLAIVRSLVAGEPGAIIRAALVDVPATILTTTLSVTVAWMLIRLVDQASLAVSGDVADSMGRFSAVLSTADALNGAGLLGVIFGLLFVVGSILVWLQLLVRSAMLYILVVLAPLGLAARAHPGTRSIARRTIEMGVALILSKFAIAVAFGVGAAAIDPGPGSPPVAGGDLTAMMTGAAVMLMAAFMPWVIWKAIPVVEAAAVTAGVERAPVRTASTAASVGLAAGMGASRLAGSGSGSGAGTGAVSAPTELWGGAGSGSAGSPSAGAGVGSNQGPAQSPVAGARSGGSTLGRTAGAVRAVGASTPTLVVEAPVAGADEPQGGSSEGNGQ